MGKDKDLERSKKNPRSETIERQIQRMIYPSRSHAHRVRRAQQGHGRITQRESNIMQFVNGKFMNKLLYLNNDFIDCTTTKSHRSDLLVY